MKPIAEPDFGRFDYVAEFIARGNPAWELLGIELRHLEEGRSELYLPFRMELCNPRQSVHGGIVSSLLDAAGGSALYTTLPEGARLSTVELKVNFLAPLRGDSIGEGKVVKSGSRIGVASVQARAAKGELCAVGLITYALAREGG